jgi:hypothetical protein
MDLHHSGKLKLMQHSKIFIEQNQDLMEKQQNFISSYGNLFLYMYHCLNIMNTQKLLLIQS